MIFLGNVCRYLGLVLMGISHLVIGFVFSFSFLVNTLSLSVFFIYFLFFGENTLYLFAKDMCKRRIEWTLKFSRFKLFFILEYDTL